MGSSIHVWRLRYWRHCCLCLFSILISAHSLANPSGRYTYPGGNDLGSNSRFDNFNFGREATAARASGNLIEAHKDGSFTIYDKADSSKARPRSVPVKRTSNINPSKLSGAVSKKLIGGLGASIVVGALWDEAMGGLDWVMNDGAISKRVVTEGGGTATGWKYNRPYGASNCPTIVGDPFVCPVGCSVSRDGIRYVESCQYQTTNPRSYSLNGTGGYGLGYYNLVANVGETLSPVSVPEIETGMMDFVNNKANNAFLTRILKDACVGSLSPNRCFETLAEHSALSGPDFMKGPTTEISTRVTNPDGTFSDAKTKTEINYNLSYQGDTITVKTETKTTNYKDGVETGETVTEEEADTEMNPETKPEEEEQAIAVPCEGVLCEPPEYEQQFEELEQTKEGIIDDYHQTILNAPIFQAVGGFFDISANATCPVWQTNVDFSVFEATMKSDLVFDYHCKPEFMSYRQWALAVMLVVAGFAAFRIGVLD